MYIEAGRLMLELQMTYFENDLMWGREIKYNFVRNSICCEYKVEPFSMYMWWSTSCGVVEYTGTH